MKKDYVPYSKLVLEHFKHPKNVGKIKNANGTGRAGNFLCGDVMDIYLKIKKDKEGKERISDIKFQTFGCIVAIANTSMLTKMVKGKTLEEALKITKDDLLKKLGEVPPIKIHCSVLALDALHEALYDYYLKNKLKIPIILKKEHNRIGKTLKDIEEKYKQFTEMQEKFYEK